MHSHRWPLVAALSLILASQARAESEMLTIGSTAPPLEVDHWFSLGQAEADGEAADPPAPVGFEPDGVYVVEFWATWCGPCVMSIPHISSLQEAYREKGVTVVSVSDESVDTIEPFFDRPVRGFEGPEDEAPTYGNLMSAYRVGSDEDHSVSESYMRAAGQNGIPCAFVVGKTGQIEWIGHPMQMDPVLEQVIDDSWDREAFAKEFRLKQLFDMRMQEAMASLQRGEVDRCRELVASLKELSDDPSFQMRAEMAAQRAEVSIFLSQLGRDPAADAEGFRRAADAVGRDLNAINQFAWRIYQMARSGMPISAEVLQLAADATEEAMDPGAPNGNALDTIGHLYHQMGKLDTAIDYMRRASAAAQAGESERMQQQIQEFLGELLAEQAAIESGASDDE